MNTKFKKNLSNIKFNKIITKQSIQHQSAKGKIDIFSPKRLLLSKMIGSIYFKSLKQRDELIDDFFRIQNKFISTRGLKEAVNRSKIATLTIYRYLSGNIYKLKGHKLYKGLLKDLQGFIPLILKKDRDGIKLCLSLFILYRHALVPLDFKPNLSQIQANNIPLTKDFRQKFEEHVKMWMKVHRLEPKHLEWEHCHLTAKNSPMGPAMMTAIESTRKLDDEIIRHITKVSGNSKLEERIRYFQQSDLDSRVEYESKTYNNKEKNSLRKLGLVRDMYYKGRVIAMGDYWSQAALRNLHGELSSILKKLPEDCTYDQQSFKSKLPKEGMLYSVDLTAATDLFPLEIEEIVVTSLYPQMIDSWRHLMVGYS